MFIQVTNYGDKQHLQNDLYKLVKWSEKLQMLLNFGKYKYLCTGHGIFEVNNKMGDTFLGTTEHEKDIGVTISTGMNVSQQCSNCSFKGKSNSWVD